MPAPSLSEELAGGHATSIAFTRLSLISYSSVFCGLCWVGALADCRRVRLSQIAISVADLRRAQRWYREVLGLEPAGGTNLFAGPLASMVQGVPRAASTCWWLVDRQDLFQIELFEFRSPLVRSLPRDWRPCDIGYTTISFWVADLDAALERAAAPARRHSAIRSASPGRGARACATPTGS